MHDTPTIQAAATPATAATSPPPAREPRRTSFFQTVIRDQLRQLGDKAKDVDPRHVEAFMRLENDNRLDLLTTQRTREEVVLAVAAVHEAGPVASEQLAKSYAL